jgi:hypothetical protein
MSKWIVLFVLIISACGKVQDEVQDVGAIRNAIESEITVQEQEKMDKICDAIASKDTNYKNSYVNNAARFNFTVSYKPCSGASTTDAVVARLVESGGVLSYSVVSGSNFQSYPETPNSGLIKQLCSALDQGKLKKPFVSGSSAIWFKFSNGDTGCRNANDTTCLEMEIGYKQTNTTVYKVVSKDIFAISLLQDVRLGQINTHQRIDNAFCSKDGEQVEYTATLNSITN